MRKSIIARMAIAVFSLGLWAAPASADDLELLMIEADGCTWCARWHAEVGPEYPLTPEGQIAPLRLININAPLPADIMLDRRAIYTPTFILLKNGAETGRLEGYPGEDFFWGLLGQLIAQAS